MGPILKEGSDGAVSAGGTSGGRWKGRHACSLVDVCHSEGRAEDDGGDDGDGDEEDGGSANVGYVILPAFADPLQRLGTSATSAPLVVDAVPALHLVVAILASQLCGRIPAVSNPSLAVFVDQVCAFAESVESDPAKLYSTLALSSVVAFVILRQTFSRVRGLFGGQEDDMSIVNIKWGRERLAVPLPSPDTKLSSFRETLAERTHIPPNGFKLLHAGAVMKDDNAPLSSYHIRPGATIVLLDSSPASAPSAPAPAKAPKTEQSTIDQIRSELASVKGTLEPGVDAFLRALSPTPTPTASAPTTAEADPSPQPNTLPQILNPADDPATQHTRLGELLLQALLRLDAIGIESGWTDARAERKGAVRTVQGVLDRLDGGWKAAKAKAG